MIITILRKSLDGSVVDNTLKHGCGAINIDATRIGTEVMVSRAMGSLGVMHDDDWVSKPIQPVESVGRWPANFILVGDDTAQELDQQSGVSQSPNTYIRSEAGFNSGVYGKSMGEKKGAVSLNYGDSGGASRFFKQFKKENN